MSSQEAKAHELVKAADKKLTSWFASFTGSKYEDAEEIYKKAANQFKVAKCCTHACHSSARACAWRHVAHKLQAERIQRVSLLAHACCRG